MQKELYLSIADEVRYAYFQCFSIAFSVQCLTCLSLNLSLDTLSL